VETNKIKDMEHFKSLSKLLGYMNLPAPEHPMLSILSFYEQEDFISKARKSSPPISCDCYSLSFKKVISGDLNYGKTKYDCDNGALVFMAPQQVIQWNNPIVIEQTGFMITFHKDFIKGTNLEREIKKYGFFSYSANEALHLSPKEEKTVESIFSNIETEYHNNQDEFSKEIILSQLESLLKYSDRFYKRQFINREDIITDTLSSVNLILDRYFHNGGIEENGLPHISELAKELAVSPRYLSDSVKSETGKTITEHIHLFLIAEAKNLLLQPNISISETAYKLGFEYPQYFSRLFKKKVGMSPKEYVFEFSSN
jgi:AraC-like DNA-binding protein